MKIYFCFPYLNLIKKEKKSSTNFTTIIQLSICTGPVLFIFHNEKKLINFILEKCEFAVKSFG